MAQRKTLSPAPRASLRAYHRKRDLAASGEPAGTSRGSTAKLPRFVIQKHDATRLHYDLRLEMDGVYKSWAVPKGLPLTPGDKALAIEVEDHPLDYGNFEGTIPAGNYGAGTVMLWDRGFYTVEGSSPSVALRRGKIHFALAGEKSLGEWTLVRTRGGQKDKINWLVIKNHDSAGEQTPRVDRERSVLTGRTMDEIAAGDSDARRRSSTSKQTATTQDSRTRRPATRRKTLTAPEYIEPMKALAVEAVPKGDWQLELKFDGYRAIALVDGDAVALWSRNRNDLTADYPEVADALKTLRCRNATLDGELVALDEHGRSSFQLMQQRELRGRRPAMQYFVFDLLHLDGRDFRDQPLTTRRSALETLLADGDSVVRLSPIFDVAPEDLMEAVREKGLEGIVAKRRNSRYEPGRRSGAWLKCRLAREQEFVIGGFTAPKGSRTHFGSLLIGYYEGDRLLCAGKVGSGFDDRLLESLHRKMSTLERRDCPFANLPSAKRSRFGSGLTAAALREVTWLDPELVCQVRFTEWTDDGSLRHPVFLGLRSDKRAREVVREPLAR
jgi:bifunctional non-homologous end joining protein LigD